MVALPIQMVRLSEIQRIRRWHVAHRADHPLEYHLWDAVLTLWVIGSLGWVPALVLDAWWAVPLLLAAFMAPQLYIHFRRRANRADRLRCDWLNEST